MTDESGLILCYLGTVVGKELNVFSSMHGAHIADKNRMRGTLKQ